MFLNPESYSPYNQSTSISNPDLIVVDNKSRVEQYGGNGYFVTSAKRVEVVEGTILPDGQVAKVGYGPIPISSDPNYEYRYGQNGYRGKIYERIYVGNEQTTQSLSGAQQANAAAAGMFPKTVHSGARMLPTAFPGYKPDNTNGGNDDSGDGGGGNGAVDPPKQSTSTNNKVSDQSQDMLSMPDLDKEISDEIDRLTLDLTNDMKEFSISKTVDYESIDFFPGAEVQIVRPVKIKYFRETFNDICQSVRDLIAKSIYASEKYNYAEYINLFEVQYNNNDGTPTVSFKVQLPDYNMDGLEVAFLKRREK